MLRIERVDGKDIATILQNEGSFSEDRARHIIDQVLRAAEYLHSRHIVHLDFKPQNIMIDSNDVVKIVDFGIARKFLWPLKAKCGTLGFVAPDIMWGDEIDARTDIYSIGVTLYAMLTNDMPSADKSPLTLLAKNYPNS